MELFHLAVGGTAGLNSKHGSKRCQLKETLFEFSGACAGCGETPYLKQMTQLFGDRALIANATGCSSIYGGNLPTAPYTTNADGRGPAWSNSLFEDNAEFGLGMRLAVDHLHSTAQQRLRECEGISDTLRSELLANPRDIDAQRQRIEQLRGELRGRNNSTATELAAVADYLVDKSIWIVGGDGWAYDIGYGGLDHVLASGANVNVLVLDTGVYSNTGGQSSKATPRAAVAKFAAAGKEAPRKDLGAIAMSYGNIYVAQIAYGANPSQMVKALGEAESYQGPSLIIAYSHCIAHGIDMTRATDLHKTAVNCGFWPLYRFDPRNPAQGKPALRIDSKKPSEDPQTFLDAQGRFRVLSQSRPQRARDLAEAFANDCAGRWQSLEQLASQ